MSLNQVANVTYMHLALGSHEDEIAVHVDGIKSSAYWGTGQSERVRLTTLPQLMRELQIDRVDLLKLDCEGAEWDILLAAEQVLPQIQQICLEFHRAQGWTGGKLATWLRERGYQVRHTAGPWNGMLWAWQASSAEHQTKSSQATAASTTR